MKVLITGAGGNLGRVLAPTLAENGHEPVLMDYRPINTTYRFIQGDVTHKVDVLEAVQGSKWGNSPANSPQRQRSQRVTFEKAGLHQSISQTSSETWSVPRLFVCWPTGGRC